MIKNSTLKSLITHPLFLLGFFIKISASLFFISDIPSRLFIPFLTYAAQTLQDPYQHFYLLQSLSSFPYPPAMLYLMVIPFLPFASLLDATLITSLDAWLLRLPLIAADILVLYLLVKLKPKAKKSILILYWLSPIIFYINYLHGQLDIIPISLLLLGLYLLFKERTPAAGIAIALSLATKSHILLALPFVFLYLYKRQKTKAITFSLSLALTYALLLLPFINSQGFWQLVFNSPEQFRLFDLALNLQGTLQFYIVIAILLYLFFKAYSFREIPRNILFMFIGVTFTMLVTLIKPGQGWYLWSMPFLAYYLIGRPRKEKLLYLSFTILYFAYFALIPDTDFLTIFQLMAPQLSSLPTPYSLLGENAELAVNLAFTLLASNLLYLSYKMYQHGVHSGFLFEQQGLPVIGIAGDSGSGKTTLAAMLTNLFSKNRTTLICGDDVHRWERGHAKWKQLTHLDPASNKLHEHYHQLAALRRAEPIKRRMYDHDTGYFTKPKTIRPKSFIVDEGLHTFMLYHNLYDLKIYMDPDPKLKLFWKISRDVGERGHTKAKVLQVLKRRSKDANRYISPQKEHADLVIAMKPQGSWNQWQKNQKTLIQFEIKSDIPLDQFLELLSNQGLEITHTYPTTRIQKIIVKNDYKLTNPMRVAEKLTIDYSEYGLRPLKQGREGLLQLLIIYLLDHRLRERLPYA